LFVKKTKNNKKNKKRKIKNKKNLNRHEHISFSEGGDIQGIKAEAGRGHSVLGNGARHDRHQNTNDYEEEKDRKNDGQNNQLALG